MTNKSSLALRLTQAYSWCDWLRHLLPEKVMPGLHIRFNLRESAEPGSDHLPGYREALHYSDYEYRTLHSDSRVVVASTGYNAYPVRAVRAEGFDFFVEGYLYDRDDRVFLRELAEALRVGDSARRCDRLKSLLMTVDGDFVIAAHDTAINRWHIVNDMLARLPLYFAQDDEAVTITREMSVATASRRNPEFDRIAGSQMMLFGYQLGHRTVVEGVERVAGGTYVSFDAGSGEFSREVLHTFDFGDTPVTDYSIDELVALFRLACESRAKLSETVTMGLSGGHDSRTVAAGLATQDIPVKAFTWTGWQESETRETSTARIVAETLGIPWQAVATDPPTVREGCKILRMKRGLLYTGLSFGMPYLEFLADTYGRGQMYFSGDGGDMVLPCLQPAKRIASDDEFVRFLVRRDGACAIEQVAQLCRMSEDEILHGVASTVTKYPERKGVDKFIHFHLYETGIKWCVEGEDRNRNYFWACTPFYSLPFFRATMAITARAKKQHKLYREFLHRLSPEMTRIIDANRGLAMGSRAYYFRILAVSLLQQYPPLLSFAKRMLGMQGAKAELDPAVKTLLRGIKESRPESVKLFDVDYFLSRVEGGGDWSWVTQHNFLTALSAAEMAVYGTLSCDKYSELSFVR